MFGTSTARPAFGIARNAFAPAVHHPERVLRFRDALFGEGAKKPDRRHLISAVIDCHAVFPGARNGAHHAQNLRGRDQAADNHFVFMRRAPPLDSTVVI